MSSFIKKLVKEGKIKCSEASKDVSLSYLEKSDKSLLSSKTLITIGNFDDATALTYYSMYYSSLALLYFVGIKSENHAGTIILLKELFEIDNSSIQIAKKEHVDKQYYVDFKATKNEVEEGITIAEEFNAQIKEKIETLKNKVQEDFKQEYFL